jgi:hypothetical protein
VRIRFADQSVVQRPIAFEIRVVLGDCIGTASHKALQMALEPGVRGGLLGRATRRSDGRVNFIRVIPETAVALVWCVSSGSAQNSTRVVARHAAAQALGRPFSFELNRFSAQQGGAENGATT